VSEPVYGVGKMVGVGPGGAFGVPAAPVGAIEDMTVLVDCAVPAGVNVAAGVETADPPGAQAKRQALTTIIKNRFMWAQMNR
jgi:hypothetical protein